MRFILVYAELVKSCRSISFALTYSCLNLRINVCPPYVITQNIAPVRHLLEAQDKPNTGEVLSSHFSEYEGGCLLGCCVV